MTALQILSLKQEDLDPLTPTSSLRLRTLSSSGLLVISTEEEPEEKSTAKTKVNNTVSAPACAVFSSRSEMCASASLHPFDAGEKCSAETGDDDGVRVRLTFSVNFQIHLGTFVNGVYHPKGCCNGRRLFCRSLGGGGCPHLFLYYLPDRDCWAVGLYPGDGEVYAVCGPAGDQALQQSWQVWDGKDWLQNPPSAATCVYRNDQQTARWEDQAASFEHTAAIKKAHHDVRHKLYTYAIRAGFKPLLEKGGILQDHVIVVATDLVFEVDESLQDEPCRKLAWDVKIISALDAERFSAQDTSPLGVAEACKDWNMAYNNRAKRCADERKWHYEPIVFTVQGHLAPEAEWLIALLATAIANVERQDTKALDGEIRRSMIASLP